MPSLRLVDLDENHLLWLRPPVATEGDPVWCTQFDLGAPTVRESAQERSGSNGMIDHTYLYGSRSVTASLNIHGNGEMSKEQVLDKLTGLCNPANRFYVYVQRNGWDGERRLLVRPTPFSCVSNRVASNMFTVELSLVAASGDMEASSSGYVEVRPGSTAVTGIFTPVMFPVAWSPGNTTNTTTVFNPGNTYAPVQMIVYGRCVDPTITNQTTGEQFGLKNLPGNGMLETGQQVVIDTDKKTVLENDDVNLSFYSYIDWEGNSSWFQLAPGSNLIKFTAQNADSECKLEIYYRSRWI